MQGYEDSVRSFLAQYHVEVTQYQFDALVSFTYNLGTNWFDPSSRICSYLIDGIDHYTDMEIVNAIGIWCHTGEKINNLLIERRMAEAKLFLYDDYGNGDTHHYNYLIFNAGDGSMDDDIIFYEQGKPYGALPEAKRVGYIFAGWHTDSGEQIGSDAKAGENRTVFASWSGGIGPVRSSPYSDVSEKDWFYTYVNELSNNGVISGYPDGTFKATNSVTCGEALKLILRAAGYDAQNAATGSHWASGYLKIALSKGLINAKDIPDLGAAISRVLIARIAANALGLSDTKIETPFADTSDGCVLSLYEAGIIEGSKGAGGLVYKPKSSITRAEISAIVSRISSADIEVKHNQQIQYGSYSVDVLKDVPVSRYDSDCFNMVDGVMRYDSSEIKSHTGIDVSEYQGEIDWQKVKASGIDYTIIRLGNRGYTAGGIYLDSYFESNIKGALDAGLDVGVYFFSQAITVEEAREEAQFVLTHLKGYDITYPVVFDWEDLGTASARTNGLESETLSQCATAFCDMISEAGYMPMIYFTSYIGYVKYDLSRVQDYEFWFAQYSGTPSFYYDYQMWQYTSSGTVDGISGDVDMNVCFKNY